MSHELRLFVNKYSSVSRGPHKLQINIEIKTYGFPNSTTAVIWSKYKYIASIEITTHSRGYLIYSFQMHIIYMYESEFSLMVRVL